MEVTVEFDFTALESLADHLLDSIALWEDLRAWIRILAIQVMTRQAASIVTNDNPIRVQHWNYLEDVPLAEGVSYFVVADEELQQALDDVGTVAFTWVNSSSDNDALPPGNTILRAHEVRYNKHFKVIAC